MKNKIFVVSLALLLGIGCANCTKENVQTNEAQTEDTVIDSKITIHLNHVITRTDGTKWTIKGTIDIKGRTVDYDIVLTDSEGKTYHFKGTAIKATNNGNKLSGYTGDIYDENGNIVTIPDFLEILESVLEIAQEKYDKALLNFLMDRAEEEFGDSTISVETLLDFFVKTEPYFEGNAL